MTAFRISAGEPPRNSAEWVGLVALLGSVAALQVSIVVAESLVAVALLAWIVGAVARRQWPGAPAMFWPLVTYAALTLLSALFSSDPARSVMDCKQLLLFLLVPATYELARGARAQTVINVTITAGAAIAIIGIIQFGVLHYDSLGNRPRGLLGHYMTYSGVLMLVFSAASARVLFGHHQRIWAALVLPALAAALAFTFTRNAWIGACAALALLLVLRDLRLLAALPVLAVVFLLLAPHDVIDRFYSVFNLKDPTNRDRLAMLESGAAIVKDHPVMGVGPDMIRTVYPTYRRPGAVEPNQPHLHNVPIQIAAERGVPALVAWAWFVVATSVQLWRMFKRGPHRALPAAALASLAAMLAAGLFEYNFGDSEFLILLLVMLTLPYASARVETPVTAGAAGTLPFL